MSDCAMLKPTTSAVRPFTAEGSSSILSVLCKNEGGVDFLTGTANRPFYFFHIPRTAGTTFRYSILTQYFKPSETCTPFDYKGLIKLPSEELVKYRLFRGHFYYFLYRLLPQRPVYLTFLRNPLERVISGYELMVNDTSHYLHRQICAMGSFHTYLQSEYPLPDSTVRTLAADFDPVPVIRNSKLSRGSDLYLDQALAEEVYNFRPARSELELAKRRLQEFEFFGLQEYFSESLQLLVRTFGWKQPRPFETRNVSPTRHIELRSMPKETLDLLVAHNQLDLELYEFALYLFKERLKTAQVSTNSVKAPGGFARADGKKADLPKQISLTPRYEAPQGRTFAERPLYFLFLPFAVWPEFALELQRAVFVPSQTCRAWNYPDLFALPPQLYSGYRFFRGSFFYPISRAIGREVEYMTFIPDSITCMHRIYKFILSHPENPFHARVRRLDGFGEYAAAMANPLVKALSADFDPLEFATRPSGAKDETIVEVVDTVMNKTAAAKELDVAKQRLQGFAFIGLEERVTESLALMTRTFGWHEIQEPERFVLKDSEGLSDASRAAVSEYFSVDDQFHQFAAGLFEKRLLATTQAPGFPRRQQMRCDK